MNKVLNICKGKKNQTLKKTILRSILFQHSGDKECDWIMFTGLSSYWKVFYEMFTWYMCLMFKISISYIFSFAIKFLLWLNINMLILKISTISHFFEFLKWPLFWELRKCRLGPASKSRICKNLIDHRLYVKILKSCVEAFMELVHHNKWCYCYWYLHSK
jgi:hypothetical protein